MDTKPNFAERIAALKNAAETVMLEVIRMEAAERRFAEKKQGGTWKKAGVYKTRAETQASR